MKESSWKNLRLKCFHLEQELNELRKKKTRLQRLKQLIKGV